MAGVGNDRHGASPKGGQHQTEESLDLCPDNKERCHGIELHKDDNCAHRKGDGRAGDRPLSIFDRLWVILITMLGLSN